MRFPFRLADGQHWQDEHALDLASPLEARLEAIRFAGDTLLASPSELWREGGWHIVVTDGEGRAVATIDSCGERPQSLH